MKNIALLLFVLFTFSCKQKAQPVKLSGKYVVVGFKVKNDMQKNGSRLISVTNGIDYAFNFISSKSLQINPKLGLAYFSDSIFKYEITDKTLYLLGKNGEHFIPYRRDGSVLNLYINKNGIDTLQIIPAKTTALN
ncbi:MAG TPA: hypothetical protein VK668_09970 [Mucilaginibacter sp.]|nr:hypothetical protein [Mucilaginibacter sp.]